jgi:hypothetical protein
MLVYIIENVKRLKVQLRVVVVVISIAPASSTAIIHLCVGIEKEETMASSSSANIRERESIDKRMSCVQENGITK